MSLGSESEDPIWTYEMDLVAAACYEAGLTSDEEGSRAGEGLNSLSPGARAEAASRLARLGVLKWREQPPGFELDTEEVKRDHPPNTPLGEMAVIASIRQRLAQERLVRTYGTWNIEELMAGMQLDRYAVGAFISHYSMQGQLFTVDYRRQQVVPKQLLDEDLEPIAKEEDDLQWVIRAMQRAGMGGWQLWEVLSQPPYKGDNSILSMLLDDPASRSRAVMFIEDLIAHRTSSS